MENKHRGSPQRTSLPTVVPSRKILCERVRTIVDLPVTSVNKTKHNIPRLFNQRRHESYYRLQLPRGLQTVSVGWPRSYEKTHIPSSYGAVAVVQFALGHLLNLRPSECDRWADALNRYISATPLGQREGRRHWRAHRAAVLKCSGFSEKLCRID